MKKFTLEIIIILSISIITGEIVCRSLPIVSDIPIKVERDGLYQLKKNQKGKYIKGKFPRWLKANYSINNLGFNSSKEYFFDKTSKLKIAIIGDSFVEGFQVDVEKSIGRQMESLNSKISVYELGLSGFNFLNYKEIYEKYKLSSFDQVFIIMDIDDVMASEPEKQIYNNSLRLKELFFRVIYNKFYLFKYINFNHSIIRKFLGLINKFYKNESINNNTPFDITPFVLLNSNIKLVVKSKNDLILQKYYPELKFISIKEDYLPKDFGFDKHWNLNGRKNVANTLLKRIE